MAMNLDEAIEILKGSIYSARFAEAKKVVMEQDPSNPILHDVELREAKYEEENNLTSDDAAVYETNTEALNQLEKEYTFKDVVESEEVGGIIDHVVVYEPETKKDGSPVMTPEGPAHKILTEEESKTYTSLIFEAATLKARMHLTGDKEFAKLETKAKAKKYKDLVNSIVFTDLVITNTSSKTVMDGALNEIPEIGTEEYEEYITKQGEESVRILANDVEEGKAITIHRDHILASVADTSVKVETYVRALRAKAKKVGETIGAETHAKLNEIAAGFKTRLNKLEDKADEISKGKYSAVYKSIRGSLHDNKVQLIGNTIATVGLTAALATPAAPAALVVYGAYFAASAQFYPIIERARRNNRARKEKGEAELKFGEAYKEAKKQILAKTVTVVDEETGETKEVKNEERQKYIRRAVVKSAIAIVSFGLLARAVSKAQKGEMACKVIKDIKDAKSLKQAAVYARTGATVGTQLTDTGVAGVATLKNASAENKNDLKNAAIGLGVGVAASALTQILNGNLELFGPKGDEAVEQLANVNAASEMADVSNVADVNAAPEMAGASNVAEETGVDLSAKENKLGQWWHNLWHGKEAAGSEDVVVEEPMDAPVEEVADTTGVNGGDVPTEEVVTGPVFDDDAMAPEAWSKDMGITKSEYLADMRKENNVDEYFKYYHYKLHNEDIMPRNAYEHAWMKLSQDGIMDRFPEGTTKEQVITQYFAMFGHFRRNVNLVAGSAELPKDAFWEHSEEMQQMYHFLFCDEDAANVKDETIAHIMNAKEYMMEHSDANNHNVITKFVQDCDNTGKGSKWTGIVEQKVEAPEIPEQKGVVIEDEPVDIPEEKPIPVRKAAVAPVAPKQEQASGREGIFESPQDLKGNAAVQRDVSDETAGKNINALNKRAGRNR